VCDSIATYDRSDRQSVGRCRCLEFINNMAHLDSRLSLAVARSVRSGQVHQLDAGRCIWSSSRRHSFQLIATLRRRLLVALIDSSLTQTTSNCLLTSVQPTNTLFVSAVVATVSTTLHTLSNCWTRMIHFCLLRCNSNVS